MGLIVTLVIIVWPIFFIALWSAIVFAFSLIGGWWWLARRYRAAGRPEGGRSFPSTTGSVGISRYSGVLTVTTNERGMFIEISWIFRIGHPTLFIPWSDIRNARRSKLLYWEHVAFDIGDPKLAGMRLRSAIFDGTPLFID